MLLKRSNLTIGILATLSPSFAFASSLNTLPSTQSYTGLMFTPNAQVLNTGKGNLSYHQGVPHQHSIRKLDDWFFAAGVFIGLEAGGRIVTQTYNHNCYTDGCGIRDLSASAKYQLPFVHDYTGLNLAIGAQDIGGAANNFSTQYIVADKTIEPLSLRLSAGYGQSKQALGVLNGAFAGIEWQPFSFMQLVGEYDATALNANAKLFTPHGFLPWGAQLSADYQLYTGHKNSQQNVWGINASMPLTGFNFNKPHNLHLNNQQQRLDQQLAEHQSSSLTHLISTLRNEGFLNVNVGYRHNKLVIALENRRYNRNQMDGVGVALGIIASQAGNGVFADASQLLDNISAHHTPFAKDHPIELILLTNGLPLLSVTTTGDNYREFLNTGQPDHSLQFSTYLAKPHFQHTQWLYHTMDPGFGRSQVILAPALKHRTATEYGFFDHSLALSSNLYTPLWQGAAVDLRYMTPISNSDDFKPGGYWQNSAYDNHVDRALVHQAFQLPANMLTQFTAGYIQGDYWGASNETRWYSSEGHHMIGVEISHFMPQHKANNNGEPSANKQSVLANYTYSLPEYNWQLSLQGGEYWQGDHGMRVTSSHWLGDTQLSASYLTSKAKNSSEFEDFFSVNIAIPLTLWRSMKPHYVQIKGTDQFTYTLQTRIGDDHNNINNGLGAFANFEHNIDRQYENRGRLTPAYFNANIQRLRNAYLRYLSLDK